MLNHSTRCRIAVWHRPTSARSARRSTVAAAASPAIGSDGLLPPRGSRGSPRTRGLRLPPWLWDRDSTAGCPGASACWTASAPMASGRIRGRRCRAHRHRRHLQAGSRTERHVHSLTAAAGHRPRPQSTAHDVNCAMHSASSRSPETASWQGKRSGDAGPHSPPGQHESRSPNVEVRA